VLYRFGTYTSLIFGALLVITIIFLPGGLAGIPWNKLGRAIFKSKKAGG